MSHRLFRQAAIAFGLLLVLVVGGLWKRRSLWDRRPLRVGYSSFAPYVIPQPTGPPKGLAAEMVIKGAALARVPIQWVPVQGPADEALTRGQVDMFPMLTLTPERQARFYFSEPWWQNEIGLISLEKAPLPQASATDGKRVAIRGFPIVQQLGQKLFQRAQFVRVPQMEQMLPALCSGKVDAFFLDIRLLESQLLHSARDCSGQALHIAAIPNGSLLLATVATRERRAAADLIYAQIANLELDGTLAAAASRYSIYNPFRSRLMRDALDSQHRKRLVEFGFGALLLLLFLAAMQNRRIRRARLAAEESQQRFDAFMKYNPAIAFIKDEGGRYLYLNEAFSKQLGLNPEDFLGRCDEEVYSAEAARQFRSTDRLVSESGGSVESEEIVHTGAGDRHFLTLKFPFSNRRNQRLLGGVAFDITERKKAEEALRFSQFSIDRCSDAIFWLDSQGRITYANEAAARNLGFSQDELCRLWLFDIDPEFTLQQFITGREEMKLKGSVQIESVHCAKDGRRFPVEMSLNYLSFEGGEFTCCMCRDITQRKMAEEELSHQALHDKLTGLPNRRLLESNLDREIRSAQECSESLGVVYLDIDGFKLVNDTLGHATGDKLLELVAKRLASALGAPHFLARMGGDEFTAILKGNMSGAGASGVAHELLGILQEPFDVAGHELTITASIGISLFPQHGASGSELLQNADAAMYESKRRGKNRLQFFTPYMGEAARERLDLENHLRRAIEREEFSLHFQPLVNLQTGEVIRLEALLRWNHPLLGAVPPSKFIPVAEETSLIIPIGNWVLEEACRRACSWIQPGKNKPGVAVNVSVVQFLRPDFVETVVSILERTGLPPSALELEVTESVVMQGVEEISRKLQKLRALGCSIAIDDFGTGYSSLSYLQKLPIDALKIDRSFIQDIAQDTHAVSVTHALVSLAHSLGMRVVVEGIETRDQLDIIRRIGSDMGQGYLLGRPAPVEQRIVEASAA